MAEVNGWHLGRWGSLSVECCKARPGGGAYAG